MKKRMAYDNFRASITYSRNFIIGGNSYSFNHSYNYASNQRSYANHIDRIKSQNSYSIPK